MATSKTADDRGAPRQPAGDEITGPRTAAPRWAHALAGSAAFRKAAD